MSPTLFGMYVLVLVGAFIGVMTAYRFRRESSLKHAIVGFIAAIGFTGVGSFGPSFLSDLGDFVVVALENPSPENLQEIVAKVDKGEIPQDVARSLLVRYSELDVTGFQAEMKRASQAAGRPEARKLFDWCLDYSQQREQLEIELKKPEIRQKLPKDLRIAVERRDLQLARPLPK